MSDDAAAVAGPPATQAGDSLSCFTCRERKLRCDKIKPLCTRCAKSRSDCAYPEARRKPASKRRNVKELEERLAQVEDLLKQATGSHPATVGSIGPGSNADAGVVGLGVGVGVGEFPAGATRDDTLEMPATEDVLFEGFDYGFAFDQVNSAGFSGDNHASATLADDCGSNPFASELIDLGGVFEALPPFEVMEDLNRRFFEQQQQFVPIVHPGRYMQAFYSSPHMKPPMCLQYAIWALTSNNDPKYHTYHDIFYRRARQYAEFDEMKGHGEHFITVAHAQTWCILATDEARSTMFTRAAMSCARAVRLAGVMGLHHLDSQPDESSPTLVPPRDWVELEERRRTFWGIFCIDSHCSVSTGWPHLVEVNEVTTHLPSSESAFHGGDPMKTCSIHDVFKGEHPYSSFAGSVVVCHLFNQNLKHAHRPRGNDSPEDFEYGAYWMRHRDLDNTISSAFMFLPQSFRLPENYRDPTAVNMNLNLHASVICLHHAALERIDANNLPESAKKASQDRLGAAAQEIIDILKLTSNHLNSSPRTPLAALSLFCAASVYTYFCCCQEEESRAPPKYVDNLDFILSAMEAIGRTHSMTRSFLRQALLDIDRNGILDTVRVPSAERLMDRVSNAVPHNVPLLARTRLSRHSAAQPPVPGLLSSSSISSLSSLPYSSSSSTNVPYYRYDNDGATWRQPTQPTSRHQDQNYCKSQAAAGSAADGGGHHLHKRKRATDTNTQSSSHPSNDAESSFLLLFQQQPSVNLSSNPSSNHPQHQYSNFQI
ncbi:hypothetical protein F5Y17DRAFT_437371 [Xylariaceae sp. FL0594]|nr:hypothetical protein F5Y17DRAFT_437371 [Xylariaceae sp. FL0594]